MRLRLLLLITTLTAAPLLAQTAAPQLAPADPDALTASQRADRDALIKPATDKMRARQFAEAYASCGPALAKFPKDPITLSECAQAALQSRQYQTAADLFSRALAQHPAAPWPLRLSRMEAYAELGRWTDFNAGLEELRAAKKTASDPQLAHATGFAIDEFAINGETVTAVFYPLMGSHFHTLYRFYLPKTTANTPPIQAAANAPGADDRCKDPKFQPYIDLESDDVDQLNFKTAHPDLAARGGREYSLDTYPGPCSQGLIRFYDGEPAYETLRADLIKSLTKKAAK